MSKHMSPEIRVPIEKNNVSIQRLEEKCVQCGQCTNICKDYITILGHYDLEKTKDVAICVNCGQCANVCPVESIVENMEFGEVMMAVNDPEKIVIVSTSPSVRVGLGEEFGMPDGSFVEGKMVSLLRKLGVDYVLDTAFSADRERRAGSPGDPLGGCKGRKRSLRDSRRVSTRIGRCDRSKSRARDRRRGLPPRWSGSCRDRRC